jgi:hypothetical protein
VIRTQRDDDPVVQPALVPPHVPATPSEVPAVPSDPRDRTDADWHTVYAAMRAKAGFVPKYRPPKRKPKHRPKRRLLVRDDLDLRTSAGKAFLQLITDITADLGHELSTVAKALIEGFAGATVALTDLNVKLLRGEDDVKFGVLTAHAAAINSLSKLAARLGTGRRTKPVMSMDDFLQLRRQARERTERGERVRMPAEMEIEP